MVSKVRTLNTLVFRLAYFMIFLFLLVPLLLFFILSFDSSGELSFPVAEYSLDLYLDYLRSPDWINGTWNSVIVATGTMLFSLFVGGSAAFATQLSSSTLKRSLALVAIFPLLLPPVVIAVTLQMYLSQFGMQQSYVGVILAHSLWAIPLVFIVTNGALSRFNWELSEAALDLGASRLRSYLEIVGPSIKNSILAAALIAFVISLQEFVMALFLTGLDTQTLPVLAWYSLNRALDPIVAVIASLLLLVALGIVAVSSLVIGQKRLAKYL